MSEFLNGLQAASNAVAGNVAGPVDILAFLLRKAGVPVPENAVGGSAWMTQKGLMAPVRQGASQVVGETAGLLGPIAAAAKAPQIARGLLQGGDNLATRQTLNPQTGAIVWHGSPHKFDKFDSSKIGTGEGAQAYGHGLYLADNPKVAEAYQNAGIGNIDWENATYGGRKIQALYDAAQRKQNIAHKLNDKTAISKANAELYYWESLLTGTHPNIARSNALDPDAGWPEMQAFVQSIDDAKFKNINFPDTGLYKVDLPDEKIARMLDWDVNLQDQAPEVRDALIKSGLLKAPEEANRLYIDAAKAAFDANPTKANLDAYHKLLNDSKQPIGKDIYRGIHEMMIKTGKAEPASVKEVQAVNALRKAGIPGVRYLDGNSRGAGTGTRNYVVFPGEEDALKILERNGQGLLGP